MNLDRALDDGGPWAPGGGPGILDLQAFLQGTWRLSRTIEDRRAGQRGRLDGQAVFAPQGEGLVYRERGVLRLGACTGPAERVYRYGFPAPACAPGRAPARAEVAFQDGRPFHDLDLSHGRWSVVHRCRDDLYRGSFEIEDRDRWTALWRVSGPRKDQVLRGRYDRAG